MIAAENLPAELRFEGEFGAEINSFLPFIHWLWAAGRLGDRQVITYRGMEPFYPFLPAGQLRCESLPRRYVPPQSRPAWLPTRDDHAPRTPLFELFPDYRAYYANDLFTAEKPLLVLHNKYCAEWGGPPVNFIPPELLAETLAALSGPFQIIYSRPGIAPVGADYSADHQPDYDLRERDILAAFPEVKIFEDLAAQLSDCYSYNELKLMLYANAYFHITAQGGNAHLAALFGGSLILIYHCAGQELKYSYLSGHFAYAATPAPTLLIAQNEPAFLAALPQFSSAGVIGDRVHFNSAKVSATQSLI
jgi:hypothetical protein